MRRTRISTDTSLPSLPSLATFQRLARHPLLAAAILVLAGAGAARAQGLRVTWAHCGGGGSTNMTFSCATNSGSDTLVVSFFSTYDLAKVRRAGIFMHLCLATGGVPNWWQVVPGV